MSGAKAAPAENLGGLYSLLNLPKGTRAIRVLDLETTGAEIDADTIRGTLRVVDLESNPRFVALSYVWGTSSAPSKKLRCGRYSTNITDNCWEALRHLCCQPVEGSDLGRNDDGSITIWVDAVCIDQQNDEEKFDQIPLMGAIYAQAHSVCIWLGPGTPETDEAIRYLRVAGWQEFLQEDGEFRYRIPGRSIVWKAVVQLLFIRPFHIIKKSGLIPTAFRRAVNGRGFPDIHGDIHPESLVQILSNTWTNRIWTLQEAVLARNLWVRCGRQSLNWRTVLYSVAYLDWVDRNFTLYHFTQDACQKWRAILSLWLLINRPSRGAINARTGWDALSVDFATAMPEYHKFLDEVKSLGSALGTCVFWAAFLPIPGWFSVLIYGFATFRSTVVLVFLGIGVLLGPVVAGLSIGLLGLFSGARWFDGYQGRTIQSSVDATSAMVQEILRRKCTDPRDRSYGVQAVCSKLGMSFRAADSRTSAQQLYTELSVRLLDWTGDLNLLLCASGSVGGQPSWAMDFQDEQPRWIKYRDFIGGGIEASQPQAPSSRRIGYRPLSAKDLFFGFKGPWANCTPRTRMNSINIHNQKELHVEGYEIGRISWRGAPFTLIENLPTRRKDKYGRIRESNPVPVSEVLRHDMEIFQLAIRGIRRDDALWHTYNAQPDYIFDDGKSKKPEANRLRRSISWPGIIDRTCSRPVSEALGILWQNKDTGWEYFIHICNNLYRKRRTFCIVEGSGGRYLGNCAVNAEPGDLVCLIDGVVLPLVIRKQGSTNYTIVSAVPLNSPRVMSGLLWKGLVDQGGARSRFILI
ncbi:hypothetical protein SAMD00023353_6300420 [Rosellinia necatrix]|uniref:Heterokaryon incompatibility domain-containing protein n=1 Tax=Rosellinia necatrix TaxID=77044 RepID=A0A1W2TSA1_ROSNE|nr:hypothetical protein SAMD00023353_6300420 [Rosellinia necatrix]